MSKFVQTSDTAFQWNKAVSHLGYCIVEQHGRFRLFTPDGILLDDRFDSADEASLQASYYFLESTVQAVLDDCHESKTIEPAQYDRIRESLITGKSDSLWMRATEISTAIL